MFMPIGTKRERFEFALLPGEDTQAMERPEVAWKFLSQYHGLGPDDVEILRQVVYTFQCRLATQWKRGRVLLAGDAAHTMPPYLYADSRRGIAWDEAAERLAQAQLARAEEALRKGQHVTAREAFKFAAANFVFAQMAFDSDVPRKGELYEQLTSAVAKAGALYNPPIERVEIPFKSGRLVGWLVLPDSGRVAATVLILGGMSS